VTVTFFVEGVSRPQGSKRSLGSGRMIEASPHIKSWRHDVRYGAQQHRPASWETTAPMSVSIAFCFLRPKSHYNSKGNLTLKSPARATSKSIGDIDKLVRGILDALTTVLFDDDSQVVEVNAYKRYCSATERPGAIITCTPLLK
jgi:crossover junction endodeoxyribonuclease RusA